MSTIKNNNVYTKEYREKIINDLISWDHEYPCQNCKAHADNWMHCDQDNCSKWKSWFKTRWNELQESFQTIVENRRKAEQKRHRDIETDIHDISTPDRFTEGF